MPDPTTATAPAKPRARTHVLMTCATDAARRLENATRGLRAGLNLPTGEMPRRVELALADLSVATLSLEAIQAQLLADERAEAEFHATGAERREEAQP